jgi:glycosyltransferase involved in cell wall biosynthesis/peptidoglycan/xylan/chitin deacetylase (PgdA/CDA1 family)
MEALSQTSFPIPAIIPLATESSRPEMETISIPQDMCARMPLRVGFLMDYPSPHMVSLLEAIAARRDCNLEVLYCGKASPGRNWGSPAGCVSHQFVDGFTGPMGIQFNPGILRAMRRLHVDIWVLNTIYGSVTTLMAAGWLHFSRKPWAYMNEPIRPRSGWRALLKELPLKYILNRADGILGTGKTAVEMYRSLSRNDCLYESVPYFIDLSDFTNLVLPAAPAEGQDLQFVTSCQMIQRKGIDCLLRACEELPATGWQLTLVGDGPLKSQFEKEFASIILRGRVNFLGSVPYANRATAFAGRHVFVFPSRWDGWGMVLPEALASGLPVISTDRVMSAHEFVRNAENGFIVPAGDSQALADKMQWFLKNNSLYPQMSRAARKSVERYKADLGAETLVSCLKRLSSCVPPYQRKNRLLPDKTTWSALTTPQRNFEKAGLGLRRIGKDAIIRGNVAVRRPQKAKGHVIIAYHLVLREDRKNFESHLRFFRDHFRISSLHDLLQDSACHKPDEFRLAITFDDGFRLLMQDCLEILEKNRVKACFFVPAAFVSSGCRNGSAADFSMRSFCYNYPLEPMRPNDLKQLSALGHEVGSHGLFHTGVQAMTPESATKEFTISRSMISDWTGVAPSSFAYPYGGATNSQGNPADWLRQAGYDYGLTLARGAVEPTANPFALPRHHLEGNWPIRNLRYFLLH